MSNQPHQLKYNTDIGKLVRDHARNGVPLRITFADIQKYQDSPKSLTTFYKLYRQDRESAKAESIALVGSKVFNQAVNGDPEHGNTFKSQELYLRTQGDWSPTDKTETREVGNEDEEAESAIEALMKALGKNTEDGS